MRSDHRARLLVEVMRWSRPLIRPPFPVRRSRGASHRTALEQRSAATSIV